MVTSLDNLTFSWGDSVFTPHYPSLADCGKDVTTSYYTALLWTGSTLESRSVCILPGWVSTLSSSSLRLYWASSSSCTAYSPWTLTCRGGRTGTILSTHALVCFTCVFTTCKISARRRATTTWTSPCVPCVMECATTGAWARCAPWPGQRTCLTTEPPSSLLFSCLCGVTIHPNTPFSTTHNRHRTSIFCPLKLI